MRRSSTLLIVGALAIIAAFAAADGLRSQAEPRAKPPPPANRHAREGPPRVPDRRGHAEDLRSQEVSGTLYVADEDCRVRPLGLPELEWVGAVPAELLECSFAVSPDAWLLYVQSSPSAQGGRGLGIGRIFSRDGRLVASVAQEGMIRPGG